jgi:hypothetical protein
LRDVDFNRPFPRLSLQTSLPCYSTRSVSHDMTVSKVRHDACCDAVITTVLKSSTVSTRLTRPKTRARRSLSPGLTESILTRPGVHHAARQSGQDRRCRPSPLLAPPASPPARMSADWHNPHAARKRRDNGIDKTVGSRGGPRGAGGVPENEQRPLF